MTKYGIVALLVAMPALADVIVPAPSVRAPAPDGVVLTAAQARACFPWMAAKESYFTPDAADVRRLEAGLVQAIGAVARLPGAVRAQHLLTHVASDRRFYVGVVEDGKRYIRVDGFCRGMASGDRCPPHIDDGGDCIWTIRFDLKRGTFDRFGTNGVA